MAYPPPPEGVFMVNADVSFNLETHVATLGMVIKDSNGEFVAARCFRIDGATYVRMAEASAARDVIWFAQHMGH